MPFWTNLLQLLFQQNGIALIHDGNKEDNRRSSKFLPGENVTKMRSHKKISVPSY